MIRLEREYVRRANESRAETRLALIEALSRLGLNSSTLPGVIRAEMNALARQVAAIGRDQIEPVQVAAASLARSQFEALGRFEAVPDFDLIQTTTVDRRQALARALESAAWVEMLAARLVSEVEQLRSAQESPEAAQARLLANDLAAGRVSVWREGANALELQSQRNIGTVALGVAAIYYLAGQARSERQWLKQAVAQIDSSTTDCCLRVHGQVQPLEKPFELRGTPRFADEMMHPRFHWRCRTDELLWSEDLDAVGESRVEMRKAAGELMK
jgi:hypothetical protein